MVQRIFVYLFICKVTTTKVNFRFYKQSSQATTRLICEGAIFVQAALIFLYTLKKVPRKYYVRFWKCNLIHTPQSTQNSFSRKSNVKFCIIFNMISFTNAQGSVMIRLACSKFLLLINYFDRRF